MKKSFSLANRSQYEIALAKDRAGDPQILACLGRVWLIKGKQDKSPQAMKNALDYSIRALGIAPNQAHFKFNIAFVQIQIAQLMHSLPESQRSLSEVQAASEGLDAAIESLTEIAHSKNPPYPKHDIEQRANMGRNTMRHQLERAVHNQRRYEETNAAKLQEARELKAAEAKKREEERQKAAQVAEEQKKKLAEERHKMLEISRELAEKRAEEERRKEEAEYTDDEETGERVKRKKAKKGGKRKKKGEDSDTDEETGGRRKGARTSEEADSDIGASGEEGVRPVKRRRKLARKNQSGKGDFKSSEIVVDSDSEGDAGAPSGGTFTNGVGTQDSNDNVEDDDGDTKMAGAGNNSEEENDGESIVQRTSRKNRSRRVADEDDEDDETKSNAPSLPKSQGGADDADSGANENLQPANQESSFEEDKKSGPQRAEFADAKDLSMVDMSATAAGDPDNGG